MQTTCEPTEGCSDSLRADSRGLSGVSRFKICLLNSAMALTTDEERRIGLATSVKPNTAPSAAAHLDYESSTKPAGVKYSPSGRRAGHRVPGS